MHQFFVQLNPVKPDYSQSDPKVRHFVLIRMSSVFPRAYILHKKKIDLHEGILHHFSIVGLLQFSSIYNPSSLQLLFCVVMFFSSFFLYCCDSSHIRVLYDWVATKQMMCPLHWSPFHTSAARVSCFFLCLHQCNWSSVHLLLDSGVCNAICLIPNTEDFHRSEAFVGSQRWLQTVGQCSYASASMGNTVFCLVGIRKKG